MRRNLPHRRPSVSIATQWQGHDIAVTVSYYPDSGRLGEVFANTAKGGQMQHTLADACTLISVALQHGLTVAEMSKSMAREPDLLRGKDATMPASPVGAILEALAKEVSE